MAVDVADLIFVRLAHVGDKKIVARVETPLEFFYLHLRNASFHCFLLAFFLTADSAKLVVVYQFCDGAMRPASRAIGILTQLELAKLHPQRVDEQQSSNQRIAFPEDQLDDFRGLNHTDETRQNAQHS